MKYLVILLLSIIIYFTVVIWQYDNKDRSHPYGTVDYLNNKYAKNLAGEEYGKYIYKGRSNINDTIEKSLSKIVWLSHIYTDEIIWRRCLVFSVIFSVILIIITDIENHQPKTIIMNILCFFIALYMFKHWENAHINKLKYKYTKENVKLIQRKIQ